MTIVFNGEIYNYRELRERLRGMGQVFISDSDTEVLLGAYQQWGEKCLEHLNGMFAFAIWDEAEHRLFAARDRFGEKPFYFHLSRCGTSFAFASEIKALIASGTVPFAIDDSALRRYVHDESIDSEVDSLVKGVKRLLAGERLTLSWSGSRFVSSTDVYWRLPTRVADSSLEDAAARLKALLEDSVRLRLRADVPIGTSLSGGLDSSSIVCLISKLLEGSHQRTFSARMTDPMLDEGKYIGAVLRAADVESHEVVPTPAGLVECFERLCWHMEEPFPATSMYAQYLVMELAAKHSTTVLLDGQGADEILGGYLNYFRIQLQALIRAGRFADYQREARAYSQLRGGERALGVGGLISTVLPRAVGSWLVNRVRGSRFDSWFAGDWLSSFHLDDVASRVRHVGDSLDGSLSHDAMHGPLQALLKYGDRNSMAWSREVRQPFLDHRIAEFAFTLRPELKVGCGVTKRVLRQAVKGIVPDEIINRTDKLGYQAPLGSWFCGELKDWVIQKMEFANEVLSGRMHEAALDRFVRSSAEINDWTEGRHVMRIVTLGQTVSQLMEVPSAREVLRDN